MEVRDVGCLFPGHLCANQLRSLAAPISIDKVRWVRLDIDDDGPGKNFAFQLVEAKIRERWRPGLIALIHPIGVDSDKGGWHFIVVGQNNIVSGGQSITLR